MPLTLVAPRQGKSPNYTVRGTVAVPGKPARYINKTTGISNKEHAEAIRIRWENEILDELIHGVKPRHTFEEAAVNYAETLTPGSTQQLVIVGRVRKTDGKISPCLVLDFAGKLVDDIDQIAVDEVIKKRFADRKPNTIDRNLITPLEGVINWAAKRDWCKPRKFSIAPYRDASRRWPTAEECAALVAAATEHFRTLLLFLLLTGCRLGEALRLQWEDVDLAARWLVFRNTKRNKRGPDKRGEDRGIPIHQQLVVALANLPAARDGKRTGHVFLTDPRSPGKGRPYREADGESGGGQKRT